MNRFSNESTKGPVRQFLETAMEIGRSIMSEGSGPDLNPHVGKLRNTVAPVEFKKVPDVFPEEWNSQ